MRQRGANCGKKVATGAQWTPKGRPWAPKCHPKASKNQLKICAWLQVPPQSSPKAGKVPEIDEKSMLKGPPTPGKIRGSDALHKACFEASSKHTVEKWRWIPSAYHLRGKPFAIKQDLKRSLPRESFAQKWAQALRHHFSNLRVCRCDFT